MHRLIIIGAGGFGREVLAWSRSHSDYGRRWVMGGFLDDNAEALDSFNLGLDVIAPVQEYEPRPNDLFICAIGKPKGRRAVQQTISARGGHFISLVHPTAIVAERVKFATGVIICPYALISSDAQVHEGSAIYYHSTVDHDAVVGAFSQISAHCDIAGGVTLGSGVFMGSHAAILPGVHVGDNVIVGAGAVVVDDVPPNTTVVGVPAKVIKYA